MKISGEPTQDLRATSSPHRDADRRSDTPPEAGALRDAVVRDLRAFNRDHTRLIGALDYRHRLDTPYSLPEARILYELARRAETAVTTLRADLDMDAGQLSRVLSRVEDAGLVERQRDTVDTRRQRVRLTPAGWAAATLLEQRSQESVSALLADLDSTELARLHGALRTVSRLLGHRPRPTSFRLRPPAAGDLGWVVQRHGVLYAAEYGFDERFEALVSRVVGEFAGQHDPQREAVWIAEADDEPVGTVFCVDDGTGQDGTPIARLRLLLVEPHARGLGVGRALVNTCVEFARRSGYRRMTLWTNDVLADARRLYQRAGFRLERQEEHESFGPRIIGQDWTLELTEPSAEETAQQRPAP